MHKKQIVFASKIVATAGALVALAWFVDLAAFVRALASAKIAFLGAAFLLAFCMPVLNAVKIKLLLPTTEISVGYILFTNFAAMFLRLTIPTDLGAELGRGYYLRKKTHSTATAFSAIVLDRYFGLFSQVAILSVAALAFGLRGGGRFWVHLGVGAAVAGCVLLAFIAALSWLPSVRRSSRRGLVRLSGALARLSEYARRLRSMPVRVVLVILISLVYHSLTLTMIMVTSAAYGRALGFHEAAAIAISSAISFFIPLTVGGIGVVEGIYTGLFALFSLQKEAGLAVSLSLRAMTMLLALPGALFLVFGERFVPALQPKREPKHSILPPGGPERYDQYHDTGAA